MEKLPGRIHADGTLYPNRTSENTAELLARAKRLMTPAGYIYQRGINLNAHALNKQPVWERTGPSASSDKQTSLIPGDKSGKQSITQP